jgi:hypothetical protein
MALTEQQASIVMHKSVETILSYIAQGRISFPDDLIKYKDDPKFIEIQNRIASIPPVAATQQWSEISALASTADSATIVARLSAFVNNYAANPACAQMVESARQQLKSLTAEQEDSDWEQTDKSQIFALLAHRRKYPSTSHEADIDAAVWSLTDKSNPAEIRRYANEFPSGLHRSECDHIIESQKLWKGVSTDPDIITVNDYIVEESSSPFISDALELLDKLKADELDKMRNEPSKYDIKQLNLLLENNIFSEQDLIDKGVATPRTLEFIKNPPELGSIQQLSGNPEVIKGATDVFLFGIPSSGKTCVLMSLLGASEFSYDSATRGSGGLYATNLLVYLRHGKAPGRTHGNFVTQIPGTIDPDDHPEISYPINLIEMSGEEFARRIVYNAENAVDFESLGTGATTVLTSDNPKVIFIVIDPTANGLIKIASESQDGSTQVHVVQQDLVIQKLVDMLKNNPKVLRHTNAIHFIMTKSDTLCQRDQRDAMAVDRVNDLYSHTIKKLYALCEQYGINTTSGGSPLLYTFSLGDFFVGDMFEYDATDANKIMNALKAMCQGRSPQTLFGKIKSKIN